MNAIDPWLAFAEVFADELKAAQSWTPEMMDAYAEQYAREQIATAQSEAAQAATHQEFNRE